MTVGPTIKGEFNPSPNIGAGDPAPKQARVLIQSQDDFSDFIELDATLESTTTRTAEIATAPIETGANIADHRRTQPEAWAFAALLVNEVPADMTFEAVGLLTDQEARDVASQHIGDEDPLTTIRRTLKPVDETRARTQLEKLVQFHDRGDLLDIATETGILSSMVLESLEHKPEGKGAIRVQGALKKIRRASARTVDLPAPKKAVAPKATAKTDEGKKPTAEIDDRGIVKKATDAIVAFFGG